MDITFDSFWDPYPRKQDKKYAEKCFNRLSKKKQRMAINDDFEARYGDTPKEFIPMPSKYLNRERWEDEIIKQQPTIRFPVAGAQQAWLKFAADHGVGTIPGESEFHFENRVKTEVLNK